MDLHSLTSSEGARKGRRRVGRGMGSGSGKTSGRGHKGQKARKGASRKLGFEGGQMSLVRRIPKRGFTNPTRRDYTIVNVAALDRFEDGADVTTDVMAQAGVTNRITHGIKVLGRGDLSRKLTVHAHAFSQSAREKIEAAGGTCEVVSL